jgi:hypothetical protein
LDRLASDSQKLTLQIACCRAEDYFVRRRTRQALALLALRLPAAAWITSARRSLSRAY